MNIFEGIFTDNSLTAVTGNGCTTGDVTIESILEVAEMSRLRMAMLGPIPKKVELSPEAYRKLQETIPVATHLASDFDRLCGIPIEINPDLPSDGPNPDKSKPPISRDRFCEYESNDMDWAGPAGLAVWQREKADCIFHYVSPFVI